MKSHFGDRWVIGCMFVLILLILTMLLVLMAVIHS